MDDKTASLKSLSVRVDALRRAMDVVIGGTTPDYAKRGAYKSYARTYNDFASRYISLSGERVNLYNIEAIKSPGDTIWPTQKEIFDMIYADTLILSGS